MADEHNKWLDRDAAERLLRGEPLEAVDAVTRARAARLAETLDALAVTRVDGGELRGEAAALAAFRKARESVAEEPGAAPPKARHARPAGLSPRSPRSTDPWAGRATRTQMPTPKGTPVPTSAVSASRDPTRGPSAGAARCGSGWPPRSPDA